MKLYFITGNKSKLEEVRSILGDVEQLDIDLPELQEIDAKKIVEAKLKEAMKHYNGEFIVEDTSLYLECMNGLPGPLIKWFLKTMKAEGLYKIAEGFNNYEAEARNLIGYAKNENDIHYFEGSIKGKIVKPRGQGFGFDVVFMPNGHTKTFAEMSKEEKNKISHRRLSLDKFMEFRKL